jgi:hypothetical protein
MARALTHMGDKRNAYRLLLGKSEMEEAMDIEEMR